MSYILNYTKWNALFEQEANPSNTLATWQRVSPEIWKLIWNNICQATQKTESGQTKISYRWKYPTNDVTPNAKKFEYLVGDQANQNSFNTEFNNILTQASNDKAWLTNIASQLNAKYPTNSFANQNKEVQKAIKEKVSNPKLVESNGNGGPFDDGIFYSVTTYAYIDAAKANFKPHVLLEKTSIKEQA